MSFRPGRGLRTLVTSRRLACLITVTALPQLLWTIGFPTVSNNEQARSAISRRVRRDLALLRVRSTASKTVSFFISVLYQRFYQCQAVCLFAHTSFALKLALTSASFPGVSRPASRSVLMTHSTLPSVLEISFFVSHRPPYP